MFEALSDRLGTVFRNLSGRGRISEENVREAMLQVRTALLEADVHLDVVKEFCDEVVTDAIGQEVMRSLKPAQQMIAIVHKKLIEFMGPVDTHIMLVEPRPTIVMMCGLQGSGKTTTCGKLAAYLRARGHGVMVAAADLQRPAAVEQLRTTVESVAAGPGSGRVEFYAEPERCAEYGKAVGVAVGVCQRALKAARVSGAAVLILDTAGRLHIDDTLMSELDSINRALNPQQVYLVVDAMIGQDAVNSARVFHQRLAIDGVILTKLDSDTRGGAALSVKRVTGAPIKFVGTGERPDGLEEFHPQRMADRILGMGDVVSLVEKAQAQVSEEEAEALARKMAEGRMTMDDFMGQLRSIRRMGPMKQLLGLLPGVGAALKGVEVDEKQLDRMEAIVHSMTRNERQEVSILSKSRVRRIAGGSGTGVADVNRLLKQFEMIQKVTKQMAGAGAMGRMKAMREMARQGPGMVPGLKGMPGLGGRGSTKTASRRDRFKPKKRKR